MSESIPSQQSEYATKKVSAKPSCAFSYAKAVLCFPVRTLPRDLQAQASTGIENPNGRLYRSTMTVACAVTGFCGITAARSVLTCPLPHWRNYKCLSIEQWLVCTKARTSVCKSIRTNLCNDPSIDNKRQSHLSRRIHNYVIQ
jgi:hypothetical protein